MAPRASVLLAESELPKAATAEVIETGTSGPRIRARYTCNPGHQPTSECFCVRFSPDDQYVAASYANGAIHVFNAESGKQELVLKAPEDAYMGVPLPTTELRWLPQATKVLVSVNAQVDGQLFQWNVKSGRCLHTITEKGNPIFCLDYFSDGTQFATGGRGRAVRVYDEATKTLVQTLHGGDWRETAGHSNRVFSLKYHPTQPEIILSGGWDNTVQVWDTRSGHSVRSLGNCEICGDSVDFTSDGSHILTGSWRGEKALQLWSFGRGDNADCVENIKWASADSQSTTMLFAAQCSKDPASSMILAGGSQENTAKFFSRPSSGQGATCFGGLRGLPKPVFSVDFSPSCRRAAVGLADGRVHVLDLVT